MAFSLGSLLGGSKGPNVSKEQQKQADLAGRATSLADTLLQNLKDAERNGAWDPNAQLALLDRDTQHAQGLMAGNQAAAARTLGYRPGDSEPLVKQRAISEGYTLQHDKLANDIRNNAVMGKIGAYNGTAGQVGGLYGQAGNEWQDIVGQKFQSQQMANQGGGFGSILGAVAPFLMPGAGAAAAVGGASQGGSILGGNRPGNYFRSPY